MRILFILVRRATVVTASPYLMNAASRGVRGALLRTVIVVKWKQIVCLDRIIICQKPGGFDETRNGHGSRFRVAEANALQPLSAEAGLLDKPRNPDPPGNQEAIEARLSSEPRWTPIHRRRAERDRLP